MYLTLFYFFVAILLVSSWLTAFIDQTIDDETGSKEESLSACVI